MAVFQNTLFKTYKCLTSDTSDALVSVPIAVADHIAARVAADLAKVLVGTFAEGWVMTSETWRHAPPVAPMAAEGCMHRDRGQASRTVTTRRWGATR